MMQFEMAIEQFEKVYAVMGEVYQDPLLCAVLENRRPGRIFVDDLEQPQAAYIWTFSECSYLVGNSPRAGFYPAILEMFQQQLIPQAASAGESFLSVITFDPVNRQRVLNYFEDRHPLSLGLATYRLDTGAFQRLRSARRGKQVGWRVETLRRPILEAPQNQDLADQIRYYWGSIEAFTQGGLGSCVLEQGRVVSWCFSEAYGAGAHSLNIATRRGYRRRGYAWSAAAAFIERCLEDGAGVAYLCDEANQPARVLAESLGMAYSGSLLPVDIPFDPYEFYQGVAQHFRDEFGDQQQAEVLYAVAAGLAEGC